jgi:hypothetical protein
MQYLDKIIEAPGSVDPLPRYAWYTYQTTSGNYGLDIYSSNNTKLGSTTISTGGEAQNNYSGYYATVSTAGSGSSSYSIAGTPANGVSGNIYVRAQIGSPHYTTGPATHATDFTNISQYFGTSIGEYGRYSRTLFSASGSNISRSAAFSGVFLERVTMVDGTHFTTTGEPGGTSFGQISYNDRTRTLFYARGNASNQYRAHVWRNPNISLNNTGSLVTGNLEKFIRDAKLGTGGASYYYNDFTWSTTGSSSYNESLYHNQFTLGDNGIVGMFRMTPSNQAVAAYLTLNPASTSATVTALTTFSLTTSYGIEQGNQFGARSQINWDQNWSVSYCPYYYYHCGFAGVWFYTPDPTKYYKYYYADTSHGVMLAPLGASRWALAFSVNNTDGNGPIIYPFDPDGARITGTLFNGSAIANGGTLGASDSNYIGDAYSTTTNYSALVPVLNRTAGFSPQWGY